MTRWLRQLQNEVIDFFFPRECIGCGKVGDFICIHCSKKLPRLNPPICLDGIRSVFVFDGALRDAVLSFKYRNLRAIANCLGDFMAGYYKVNNLTGDILVPVPLNEKRIRDRGYNQSELLARAISMQIGVPVNEKVIRRTRDCQPQARTKNVDERRRNMENAFSHMGDEVRGLDVVIIDDVCTSGATLEACASALKAAGAKRVTGFTLAREIKKQE